MEFDLAPLIHCRTYNKDFNPDLLYCPDDFTVEDIRWARKYILDATSYCDELQGIRSIIFNNEQNCVFGIVCALDELVSISDKANKTILKKYIYDSTNRRVKCFIGYSCKTSNFKGDKIPKINFNSFYNLFEKYIAKDDIWFSKQNEHIRLGYIKKVDAILYSGQVNEEKIGEYLISISSQINDEKIFQAYLNKVNTENKISLCTNMYNSRMVLKSNFKSSTASINVIQKVKRCIENEKIKGNNSNDKDMSNISYKDEKKNKVMKVSAFVVGVLILSVIIILLIK